MSSAQTLPELQLWVDGEIKSLNKDIQRHEKVLNGDGTSGVTKSVAKTEEAVMQIQSAVRKMEMTQQKMFTRMERAAAASEAHAEDMARRVKAVEAMIGPMVDWKKGIVLRLTTIGATISVIAGSSWWVIEQRESIKLALHAVFK